MEQVAIVDNALQRSHPLTQALISRLRQVPNSRVLEIGVGHGRNTRALVESGISVVAIDDDPELTAKAISDFGSSNAIFRTAVYARIEGERRSFDGALSTHGLLHGAPVNISRALSSIARLLKPKAPLYATFGSIHDSRYGRGRRIAEGVYAAEMGDEAGVAHAYFDETRLRGLLERKYEIESIEEMGADEIAGRWAHAVPLKGSAHWFVCAHTTSVEN